MKKTVGIILVLAVCLWGAILGGNCAISDASGATLTPYGYSEWSAFSGWYYVPSTVPDGIRVRSVSEMLRIRRENGQWDDGYSAISNASLEYVSGSEKLFNLLCVSDDITTDGEHRWSITSREAFTDPGETTFRIAVDSEDGLHAEAERTLRVLSWEEYPQFIFLNEDHTGTAGLGTGTPPGEMEGYSISSEDMLKEEDKGKYENLYSRTELIALVLKDKTDEIASGILSESERSTFTRNVFVEPVKEDESGRYESYDYGEALFHGAMNINRGFSTEDTYMFREYGEYQFSISTGGSSAYFTIQVSSYGLSGPTSLTPGSQGTYTTWDDQPEMGRTFTLTIEGEGAEFDEKTNTVTVSENAEIGSQIVITAAPSDGSDPVKLVCTISNGVLSGEKFEPGYRLEGFALPVPADESRFAFQLEDQSLQAYHFEDDYMLLIQYDYYLLDEFAEEKETAEAINRNVIEELRSGGVAVDLEETIEIDGHPVTLFTGRTDDPVNPFIYGTVLYDRNDIQADILVGVSPMGDSIDSVPEVTMSDLELLAKQITYDVSQASITVADGEITLSAKNDATSLSGGGKLQFTAAFASPDKVNAKAKNNTLEWSAVDAETGEEVENVSIDQKGVLTAGAKLDQVRQVKVVAASPIFHTSAEYELTVMPKVTGITVEPGELIFYEGEAREETVTVAMVPEVVPAIGLTWTVKPEGIIEVNPEEDGAAVIRPVKAGKANVTVKEAGGKSAKVTVSVLIPVESLELAAKGKAKAGGTVTVQAALTPKNPGNKTLEWSLDVGEDVATINKNGQVKIGKDVEPGTKITVICTAIGAPEPVAATAEIVVE